MNRSMPTQTTSDDYPLDLARRIRTHSYRRLTLPRSARRPAGEDPGPVLGVAHPTVRQSTVGRRSTPSALGISPSGRLCPESMKVGRGNTRMVRARGLEPTHRRHRWLSRSRTYRATLVASARRLWRSFQPIVQGGRIAAGWRTRSGPISACNAKPRYLHRPPSHTRS
jgi:hypothetical protein